MTAKHTIFGIALAAMSTAASAFTPEFPLPAQISASETSDHTSFALITTPWRDGEMSSIDLQGAVAKQAWKLPASELTSLQLLDPLRQQLMDTGFEITFECETDGCGGFDFRFSADVFSEPDMHVNLSDFRFLSAQQITATGASNAVTIFVSRTDSTGFVQINQLGEAAKTVTTTPAGSVTQPIPTPLVSSELGQALEGHGHAVLEGLTFQSGGAGLAESGMSALAALAQYLNDNPDRQVTLVGHTDAVGGLPGNTSLSKRRAQSVREHLISKFNVSSSQVSAEGAGYLAPRASNLTTAGREANRRVEVILMSTQ